MSMESMKKTNQVWGGKIVRSYDREITIKATGEKRKLREVLVACTPEAATHKYAVDRDTFSKGLSDNVDTLRISVWADDNGYDAACKTRPGMSMMVHTGKVMVSKEGYVNTSVKKFIYCDDPAVNYYKMPTFTEE